MCSQNSPSEVENLKARITLMERTLELAEDDLAHWRQRANDRGSALRNANATVRTLSRIINERLDEHKEATGDERL